MAIANLIVAVALQAGSIASSDIPPIPENLHAVQVAKFQRKPEYSYRESLKARKLTSGCKPTQKVSGEANYSVEVLLLTDGKGNLKQVTPISIQCPALEEYVGQYFAREGRNNMKATVNGKPAWRRSVLKFYW